MLAPVVLFVYNRPLHTQKTIEALLANPLASRTDIFIFSDAPKSEADSESVQVVRNFIRQVTGFQSVTVVERSSNYGLARSIIEGVTDVCARYGRVVVLEDDLETSPHFLQYMNDALDHYAEQEKVMHISACCYPVKPFGTDDTYFLKVPLCWGWATWKRAWDHFEKDVSIMDRFDTGMIRHFDFDDTYKYWKQLEWNRSGRISTWFVFWYAKIFLMDGLSLFPSRSLVRNIGFDNSGVHCNASSDYDVTLTAAPVKISAIPLIESEEGFEKHKEYFRKLGPGRLKSLILGIRNRIAGVA